MTTDPLRVGILGAARIAPLAIVAPAQATGTRLVAVAARDRSRAAAFATEHSVERVVDSYDAILEDPEVEVVYNPLPHGLHAPWNIKALQAGKHVISEKPSAANAGQAREVQEVARASGKVFLEAFHYPYHPMFQRVEELLSQGAIGTVQHIDVPLLMPDPGVDDPRWVWELAGGSVMDLGCYSFSCLSILGKQFCGGAPAVTGARAEERGPNVDERLFAAFEFPSGATGSGGSDMAADDWSFTLVITGDEGEIVVPSFPLPHQDDRIILRPTPTEGTRIRTKADQATAYTEERGGDVVEHLGPRSSYTFQLEAATRAIREGAPVVTDAEFSVENMEIIDAAYAAAGLPPRPTSSID